MNTEDKAVQILESIVDIDLERIEGWKHKKFFGTELNFAPRSLVLFYLALEEQFQIQFSKEAVLEGRFSTFEEILSLLPEQV